MIIPPPSGPGDSSRICWWKFPNKSS